MFYLIRNLFEIAQQINGSPSQQSSSFPCRCSFPWQQYTYSRFICYFIL